MTQLSIIEELQRDALDHSIPVSNLLRKAKLVAAKLDLPEFAEWIENELNGYKTKSPDYRMIVGTPRGFNPYNGWIPIGFHSSKDRDALSKRSIGQSVASLEELVKSKGSVHFPYPSSIVQMFDDGSDIPLGQYSLHVDQSQITGIIDAVRNAVLDWSIKLEKAGIKGLGFSFSQQEKERAHQPGVNVVINSVENFSGMIGAATTGATVNIQQSVDLDLSRVKETINQVEKVLPVAGLEGGGEDEVRQLVAGIRTEISQPNPDQPKVRGMLGMLKRVMEGATSKIIADGAVTGISALL